MFSKLGIFSMLIGFFIWLFKVISQFMGKDSGFVNLTLSSISERVSESAVDTFSSEAVQDVVYTLFYEVHLGGIIFGSGIIFLIISLFMKEH